MEFLNDILALPSEPVGVKVILALDIPEDAPHSQRIGESCRQNIKHFRLLAHGESPKGKVP